MKDIDRVNAQRQDDSLGYALPDAKVIVSSKQGCWTHLLDWVIIKEEWCMLVQNCVNSNTDFDCPVAKIWCNFLHYKNEDVGNDPLTAAEHFEAFQSIMMHIDNGNLSQHPAVVIYHDTIQTLDNPHITDSKGKAEFWDLCECNFRIDFWMLDCVMAKEKWGTDNNIADSRQATL